MNQTSGLNQGMRPGTSLRPGSNARPGTNSARVTLVGTGGSLEQPIAVTAQAPVSMEGMRTMTRMGTSAGPGRKVMDRSYCIGVLRQKIAELTAEVTKLQEEEERTVQSSSVLGQLQQKSKSLQEELGILKNTLANINLAVEKSTSQDAATVKEAANTLRAANTKERKDVDALFLKSKEAEAEMKKNMISLENELMQLDKRILAENQDHGLYKATRDEAFAISDTVLARQHEIRTLVAKRSMLMAQLGMDVDKKRAMTLLLEILKKRQEKEELSRQCSISVEEERQQLIHQAKVTRDDIEVIERQITEIRDQIQDSKTRLRTLEEDEKEYTGDNVSVFQELQRKDMEVQEFIDSFPEKEKEELEKIAAKEKEIVRILERVSTAYRLKEQMPQESSPGIVQALTQQVEEKRQQIEQAQVTHERLQKELLERKEELEKVGHLSEKITQELDAHAAKMAEQRAEMVRYTDLDKLRLDVEQRRKNFVARKAYLLKLRDNGKHILNSTSSQFEQRKKMLQDDERHLALSALEQKLRLLWQSTYALSSFVRLKEKESNYVSTKAECLRLVDEINLLHKNPPTAQAQDVTGGVSPFMS